jgi:hypothetical protein
VARRGPISPPPRLLEVAVTFAAELLVLEWLGFWLLFLAGLALAATRRSPRPTGASLLLLAIAAQLVLYFFVCWVAPTEPAIQIDAAVFRIAAALLPLGLLGLTDQLRRVVAAAASPR